MRIALIDSRKNGCAEDQTKDKKIQIANAFIWCHFTIIDQPWVYERIIIVMFTISALGFCQICNRPGMADRTELL